MIKLKNDTTRAEAMRAKFRHGRADISETAEELLRQDKLHRQGRKKAAMEEAARARIREGIRSEQKEDEPGSAGEDALDAGTSLTQEAVNNVGERIHTRTSDPGAEEKTGAYAGKLHERSTGSDIAQDKADIRKKSIRKRIHEKAAKEHAEESAGEGTRVIIKAAGKVMEAVSDIIKNAIAKIASNPMVMVTAITILTVVLVIGGAFSSCSIVFGSMNQVAIATSFTAKDHDITGANDDYIELEKQLQQKVNSIERTHPGMDEYRYNLDQVGHNPFELSALLTVLYEDYTRAEVKEKLKMISEIQYTYEAKETVEKRTRTETRYHWETRDGYEYFEPYEVEVEYDYHILTVTLKNNSMDSVARSIGLNADQIQRYELLLETFGNKKYLFEDDVYAAPNPGEYQDYDVPAALLSDVEFANMLREGEKYLGYPYKWGGSSPSTSFDCSGFVSYVINHSGNGWNVGRQTANGLLNCCSAISASEARPGDLIFFKGTYNTSGASHVGIYVGNGMMLHCGNPIQYTSVNTNYWKKHYYTYGRLRH